MHSISNRLKYFQISLNLELYKTTSITTVEFWNF